MFIMDESAQKSLASCLKVLVKKTKQINSVELTELSKKNVFILIDWLIDGQSDHQ